MILSFRKKLIDDNLSINTIVPNLKTIYYVLVSCQKAGLIKDVPDFGVPLEEEPPTPDPVPFDDLARFLEHTHVAKWPLDPEYWNRYVGFAYLTGLRRDDLKAIERKHCNEHRIKYKASKTKKTHVYPMPVWLWRMVKPQAAGRLFTVSPKRIYREMRRICNAAGIEYFTPKNIRVLSCNEWESARENCGAVIQGGAIKGWSKATGNYMTTHGLLFKGVHKLRIPSPFLTEEERNKEVNDRQRWHQMFEKLPTQMREHILGLGENMIQGS
ncbi:site-specific integrase [Gimesia fumaroli]|uniref:Phage integrase family protein n=1 Tax=Gimesia fumaroli TaxID=2527976 RepID=A0A518I8V0_9PLAN|nr:hypothetical protein [Gimesia fumaroli]QDV49517.1 Phage integrase family protein [Gimesia fumaroli]